ncbi:MAG: YceI family protein [Rhizomicrobium sp.]
MRRAITSALMALGLAAVPASAAHWTVDAAKSKLGFSVSWSNEPFVGVFKSWKADIDFDPADLPHAHAVVVVDLASETSDAPDSDDGIKGAPGFAVDKFPTARFATSRIRQVADGSYLAEGTLTIRGVTKLVTLPFKLAFDGNRVHMTGKAAVDRSDFGVGRGEWAAPTPVSHAVTVTVDLSATKS